MRTALVVCSVSLLLAAAPSLAQEFFSQPDIDYWGEKKAAQEKKEAEAKKSEYPQRRMDEREFRWEDYDDPSTDVFWDDGGDYVPPRPLRVVAADPTPDNVSRYLRWQQRKMSTMATLQAAIDRQIGAGAPGVPGAVAASPAAGSAGPAGSGAGSAAAVNIDPARQAEMLADEGNPVDWRKVDIVLFYSSDCPHCQASLGTVAELEKRGTRVIPVQMDWKKHPPLFPSSVPYDEKIAQVEKVDSVPTWIAAYGGDRITMQGEVSVRSIEVTLKMAQEKKRQVVTTP